MRPQLLGACSLIAALWGCDGAPPNSALLDQARATPVGGSAVYSLRVRLDPAGQTLVAQARIRLPEAFAESLGKPDTLTFYLHGELRVDSLTFGSGPLPFEESVRYYEFDYSLLANVVKVPLDAGASSRDLVVWYSGPFHASRARSQSDYMRIDNDGVLLRGHGYSLWYPVFGDTGMDPAPLDFTSVRVDVPDDFTAVLTGDLLGRRNEGGREISEWQSHATSAWDAQLTARRYRVFDRPGIVLYVEEDSASLAAAPEILAAIRSWKAFYVEHYGATLGRVTLHVMEMPPFGDIASGNVVGISEANFRSFSPTSFSGRTLAHEMVHAYVQVPMSSEDPLYSLVMEGFPSYFFLPAMEATNGPSFYHGWMVATDSAYRERRRTGVGRGGRPLPREKPIDQIKADQIGVWKDRVVLNDRAPLFLDWVRRRVGDKAFYAWTRQVFTRDSMDRSALESSLRARLGGDAGEDLRLWLSTTEYPERFRPNPDFHADGGP